jgi:hypothetical protein
MVSKFSSLIEQEVERVFPKPPLVPNQCYDNPVTEGYFVGGRDSIEAEKEDARRALLAREWFYFHAPRDAQPLPISVSDRAAPWSTLLRYIVSLFARSLRWRHYDVTDHPSFASFVSGVLWDADREDGDIHGHLPNSPELSELKKRFPPRKLQGLLPSFYWFKPKEYAERMEEYRRHAQNRAKFEKELAADENFSKEKEAFAKALAVTISSMGAPRR